MKFGKILLVLFLACFTAPSEAEDFIQALIPPGTPFGFFPNFIFGEVAKTVTVSSQFTIKNISTILPVTFNVTTSAPFKVTPSTGILPPKVTIPITVTLDANLGALGQVQKQILITGTRSGATQSITNWFANATIVEPKPDLTLTQGVPGFSTSGNKTIVSLGIKVNNQKNLVQSQACDGEVFIGNSSATTFPIPIIPAGQEKTIPISFETTKSGSQQLRTNVDSKNVVNELRENNNEATQTISIP